MLKKTIASGTVLALLIAACGSGDANVEVDDSSLATTVSEATASTAATDDSATTIPVDDTVETTASASGGSGSATVTFLDDGTTLDFALEECFTSDTVPGNFAAGVAPEGAFSVYGTSPDGWELNLAVLPDANGKQINFSFLTNGDDINYELGNLEYAVDGGSVSASSVADIYQTFDEVEEESLEFEVSC